MQMPHRVIGKGMERKLEILALQLQKMLAQLLPPVLDLRQEFRIISTIGGIGGQLDILLIEARAGAIEDLLAPLSSGPESEEVLVEFVDGGAVVGDGVGVDDVEDSLARDDEAVAEALAFGGVDAGVEGGVEPGGVLTRVVAGKVADDVGFIGGREDLVGGVVGGVFLDG